MDFLIFQKLNSFAGKYICLDSLAVFCAEYLGYILIAVLFLLLLKNSKKYWPIAIKGLGTALFARFVITELIRFLWQRPRPFIENQVNLLLSHEPTASFPSGHAAFFFALSAVIYFYNKKTGILFFIASFLISLSRVFCGIHWPSDILGGVIVGIFSAWFLHKLWILIFGHE